jgi:perosamine synthetase
LHGGSMSDPLAFEGGKPIISPIRRRVTLSPQAADIACDFISDARDGLAQLSGYFAGSERGGNVVQRLENTWCEMFHVKHAVACNSGTSALLAAFAALNVHRLSRVILPTMGMSAAAAAPKILGASVRFTDVDDHYHISPETLPPLQAGDIVVAVNLFGRPCRLTELRQLCDQNSAFLVEDAAQSLWATEDRKPAGTIGHIGCFSFNVHKPLNAGEGGMLVTNDPLWAYRARAFINHGECSNVPLLGLNLRMNEVTAALTFGQIGISREIVTRCRQIHERLARTHESDGRISDCYCLPLLAPTENARDYIVKALNAEGLPCRAGYVLMHRMQAFKWDVINWSGGHDVSEVFPHAEDLNRRMILIELCSIDPTDNQIAEMAKAIDTVWKSLW